MLGALLRKNLLLWRPPRSANVPIFCFAFAISLADAFWTFPAGAWWFVISLSFLIGQAGGASALSVELKDDAIQFLEILPIRWSHVWLANWLDQLFACLLLVPILCWYRVATWEPSTQDRFHDAGFLLFGSRWLLPCTVAIVLFFAFSYVLLIRTLVKGDKTALFVSQFGAVLFILVPAGIPAYFSLAPRPADIWPIPLIIAALMSLGSFIVFAIPPRHWSAMRRFLLVGGPLLVVVFIVELASVLLACNRWQKLDWSEPELTVQINSHFGNQKIVLAEAISPRSGTHHYAINVVTGRAGYLGRDILFLDLPTAEADRVIPFQRNVHRGEWPWKSSVMALTPDGSEQTQLLPDRYIEWHGTRYTILNVHPTRQGAGLLIDTYIPSRSLFFRDSNGTTTLIASNCYNFLVSADDQILTYVNSESSLQAANAPLRYRLYDISTAVSHEVDLPGEPLCISRDLKRIACIKSDSRDGVERRSMWLFDFPSGQSREIVEEGVLSPIAWGRGSSFRYTDPLPRQLPFGQFRSDNATAFDAEFRRALIVNKTYGENMVVSTVVLIDLATGARQTLASYDDTTNERGYADGLSVVGFTADGQSCVFKRNDNFIFVNPADRSRSELSTTDMYNVQFSPSGARILGYCRKNKVDVWSVCEVGRDTPLYRASDVSSMAWLDDDRLIVAKGPAAYITDVHGGSARQILPQLP